MPETLKKQFSAEIPGYQAYADAAALPFAEHFQNIENPPELLVEPGTALAGDSMKYVTRVAGIKQVRGKAFATLTGSQKNISMTGVNPPIEVYPVGEGQPYHDLDMVGYTCIESDVLYRHYSGTLAENDFVVFENCGSYSVVMKPPFILPNVPVIDICSGEAHLIKRAEGFDDLFGTYCF
jgi:diaminopimelate decarboxylase